jgi:hypothetical protein
MDATLVVSSYSLNLPLSKYKDDTFIVVRCSYPDPSLLIKHTCKTIFNIINIAESLYQNKTLEDNVKLIKENLDNKIDFDENLIICEIFSQVNHSLSKGESVINLKILLPPIESTMCNFCGEKATLKCGACKCTYYCGKECQLTDWKKSHKHICKLCTREFDLIGNMILI